MTDWFILQPGQGEPLELGPASLAIKTADTGSENLFVAEHVMPPMFAGPPSHIHEEMDHYFYILEGAVRFVIAGAEAVASEGCFAYIPRAVAHSFGNPSQTDTRFLEINVPAGFERYYRELAQSITSDTPLTPDLIYQIQERYKTRPA